MCYQVIAWENEFGNDIGDRGIRQELFQPKLQNIFSRVGVVLEHQKIRPPDQTSDSRVALRETYLRGQMTIFNFLQLPAVGCSLLRKAAISIKSDFELAQLNFSPELGAPWDR